MLESDILRVIGGLPGPEVEHTVVLPLFTTAERRYLVEQVIGVELGLALDIGDGVDDVLSRMRMLGKAYLRHRHQRRQAASRGSARKA